MTDIWYCIDLVNPEPWKVGPVGTARRGGKLVAYVGKDAGLDAYKKAVAEAVESIGAQFLDGKLLVEMFFWRERVEYVTPQARTHRKHEADATNLLKAAEDALQKILYNNDKDNIDVRSRIVEQGPNVHPRIVIHISNEIPSFRFPQEIWDSVDECRDGFCIEKNEVEPF
jgi:Holliday junction resolvase RusA-like endonuclease